MPNPRQRITRGEIAQIGGMSLRGVDDWLRRQQQQDPKFRSVGSSTGRRWRRGDIEAKLDRER